MPRYVLPSEQHDACCGWGAGFAEVLSLVEKDLAARKYTPRGPITRVIPTEPDSVVHPETRIELRSPDLS